MRLIKDGRVKKRFFELGDHDGINDCCNRFRDHNVYFGVGTRDLSGSGRKENVINVPALWTDIDFKDIKPADVRKRLDTFPYKPTAMVLTGHGSHFYWITKEPCARDEFKRVEDLLCRIAHHFNGDPCACEVARVLRVPATLNIKYDPVPVKLHCLQNFSYNLDDFDLLPAAGKHAVKAQVTVNTAGWLLEAMRGVPEGGNDVFAGRDAAGCKLAGYFIDRIPAKDVIAILRGWNTRNNPPLKDKDIQRIFKSVLRYKRAEKNEQFKTYFARAGS